MNDLMVHPTNGAAPARTQQETAALAIAEQAKATVQARYVMAMQRPRDWDEVRTRLLRDCKRPYFAAVARYNKPIGKGVVGPSIRFAEAALRAMTNVLPETIVVFDDDTKRIIRVQVTDLESNLTYTKDVIIAKTVERRSPKGMRVLGERTNSGGQQVFVCEATEDDLLNKQAAQESKALRSLALRLLPGDILDECMWQVVQTLRDETAKDPDLGRKRIASAFDGVNVSASDIAEYLGHELAKATPAEITDLRAVYEAIRDGEATWHEALAVRREERGETRQEPPAKPKAGTAGVKERLARKKKPAPKKSKEPEPPPAADGEEPDEFVAEVDDIRKGIERALQNPGSLPDLRNRVEMLPECGDREKLEELLCKAEVAVDEASAG